MEEKTFHQRFAQWNMMPGNLAQNEYFMSVYPAPLDVKFHTLSTLYLESSQQQQWNLTDFFATVPVIGFPQRSPYARFDNAIIYMRRVARCIRSATDSSLLRLGLATAVLTERRVNNHDLLVSLAFLYHSASRAGIDPAPDFGSIAATARPQVQEALRAFLHSDISTVRRMVQHYEGTC